MSSVVIRPSARLGPCPRPRKIALTERRFASAGAGVEIRLVSSAFVPAEEVVLSIFEASAEETVIEANARGGARIDRVQLAELSRDED